MKVIAVKIKNQKHRGERFWAIYWGISATAIGIHILYQYGSLENLLFMIRPVAFMLEKALGIIFYYEPDVGFVSEQVRVVINKSCAGTTFWIMSFCMLTFSFVPRIKGGWKRFIWFLIFLGLSYILTLFANMSRIITAIGILNLKFNKSDLLERLLHQSIGVLVYCTYLWIIYAIFSKLIRKEENNEKFI